MALHVVSVDDGSPAWRLGIEAGCTLLAVDDHPLHDALDYQFYTTPPPVHWGALVEPCLA